MDIVWMPGSITRLAMLLLLIVLSVAIVRFARLLGSLYWRRRKRAPADGVMDAECEPGRLAQAALAGQIPVDITVHDAGKEVVIEKVRAQQALHRLELADAAYRNLWSACEIDLISINQTLWFTLLLTVMVVVHEAYPIFQGCFEDTNRHGSYCLIVTAITLLRIFKYGLCLYLALYFVSGLLGRALAQRRMRWKYFYSRTKCLLARTI